MLRLHPVALIVCLALSACGGANGPSLPTASRAASSTHYLKQLPALRQKQDSFGGIPSRLVCYLVDAPPILGGQVPSEMDLGILAVQAVDSVGNYATIAQFATPQVINLLNYQSVSLAMGSVQIPAGTYASLRLLVDIGTSHVVLGGRTMPIYFDSTVSASSAYSDQSTSTGQDPSGAVVIELHAPMVIAANQTNEVHVDFNAAESLALDASGNVYAAPALFASPQESGIKGTVLNSNGYPVSNATVVARTGTGSMANMTTTDAGGNFFIHTLTPATYQLQVYNSFVTSSGQTLNARGQSSWNQAVWGPSASAGANTVQYVGTIRD